MAKLSSIYGRLLDAMLVAACLLLLAPMPIAFALLALEFIFRMHRLALAERRPRDDAVSAA